MRATGFLASLHGVAQPLHENRKKWHFLS